MTHPLNEEIPTGVTSPHLVRRQRRIQRTILGTALLVRLWVLWSVMTTRPHDWLYSRGIEMGLLANSLLHGHGYSSPFGGSTGPTAFIAPGYPTLIAAIFAVFGAYSFASAIAIMVLQIFVSLLTIWLIMRIARELGGDGAANLAGTFWAISIPLPWIPTIFWETTLSACALTGAIAYALHLRRRPTLARWVAMSAGCAVVALINPALLPALLAILGWAAYRTRKTSPAGWLVGLVSLVLVFSPWPIRNAYRFHAFILLRTTVGFELWMGNRPGATGYLDESLFPMYNKAELASYIAKGELPYTRDKSEQAQTYICKQPRIFLKMTARRFYRFWTGTGNSSGSVFYPIHALLTSGLGFAGLVLLYRRGPRNVAVLIGLPLLLFPMPYYITHAEFRYRLVIDPIMTILSAYAITRLAASRTTMAKEPLST